ncbi:TFIIB-type zinc ribbon-containing protein [Oceanitalea stevensii]|uniref:Zinc ribbon domain-containing protein n=1 Tax=Oceanitalea stevensii TaxID=2763072 RepID=A0ABR8Z549_9MICO|nr:TFIIB-type zinc ribbon-containing protein [Oceanitalea stevensii]MBD8063475.1 zinc ribbon domain-containing protein [Oceanitalea stevensii]
MQTCPECGGRNEDGELFCGSCGTYLEWEETQAAVATGAGTGAAGTGAVAGGDGGSGGPAARADDGAHEPAAGDTYGGGDAEPARLAATGAGPAATDEPAPADGRPPTPAPVEEPAPASAPDGAPAPAAVPAAGAGALGGLGGRAARAARRAADQATGGALSNASSTASRARSQAHGVTQAPGRAAADQAGRAAGGGPLAQAAAAAAREGTEAARGAGTARAATGAAGAGAAAAAAPPSAEPREQVASAPAVDGAEAPAAAQPSPTKPGRPAPLQPAARKPGAPVQRRPVPRAEEEEPPPRPGELVCGACGAGNAPHRHFCRRCGADLTDAPVQPQRSWWQRLLRPEPRGGPAAGTRPRARRRRRFPTGLVVTIVILGLLGAGAWYARDSLAGAYAAVVDRLAGDKPINPAEVTASSAREDRPAAQVRDGILDRSWAPEGNGVGEWVDLVLSEPARVVTVLVIAGNGGEEEQRLLEARPRGVRLTMTTSEGEEVQDVELTDTGEPQPVSVGISDVEQVRLTILSVYGEELGAPVALAEVELRGRG